MGEWRMLLTPGNTPESPCPAWDEIAQDRREDTFVLLAYLMFYHKRIYEEGGVVGDQCNFIEDGKARPYRERLKSLQDDAERYRHTSSWIRSLSRPLVPGIDVLQRLMEVWHDLDAVKIDKIVYMCGQEAPVFLHALCVRVSNGTLREMGDGERMYQFSTKWRPGLLASSDVSGWQAAGGWRPGGLNSRSLDIIAPKTDAEKVRQQKEYSQFEYQRLLEWFGFSHQPKLVKTEIYFCGVGGLIGFANPKARNADLDYLRFAVALLNSGAHGLFETPIGYANITGCWCLAFPQFVWQLSMDLTFMVLFCWEIVPVCHLSHTEHPRWPARPLICAISLFGLRGVIALVVEITMVFFWRHKHRKAFAKSYKTMFSFYCVVVEIWSIVVLAFLWKDYYWRAPQHTVKGDLSNTILYNRPTLMGSLFLAKWAQFLLELMNAEALLYTLLPAWHAIKSKSSLSLLFYFLLLCLGTSVAYFVLPAKDVPLDWAGLYTALSIMFRLDMMGEFDPSELETGAYDKQKGREDRVPEMHFALQGFTVLCGLVFPVTLLNVYIGLLTEQFKKVKRNVNDRAGKFRMSASLRFLLKEQFWPSWCKFNCFRNRCLFRQVDATDEERRAGVWIAVRKGVLNIPDPFPWSLNGEDATQTRWMRIRVPGGQNFEMGGSQEVGDVAFSRLLGLPRGQAGAQDANGIVDGELVVRQGTVQSSVPGDPGMLSPTRPLSPSSPVRNPRRGSHRSG